MSTDSPNFRSIFDQAVDITSADERKAFLDQACAAAPELRQRVDALLKAHEDAGSFLQSPAANASQTIATPASAEAIGTKIGPYKLLQQIGEGGMGTVYMAEQTEPVARRLALKIIKPGMDSRQVIARFEAERQALALMDHPNIAKMLDAGTTASGRPYFVMELVKGVSVIQYCDDNRLDVRARLELFISICQAVQHAHQKGIIHRDLKPTNVLVADFDNRPVVKIIDFGVAKAVGQSLVDRTMFTEFGQIIGTIEYMSPEQAKFNQLDIDTRTDIYSLGVLLYELLTGETPLDRQRLRSAAIDEMLRIIREEEPPKPSTRLNSSHSLPTVAANRHVDPRKLTTLVAGDLDWIVMRALDKERTRRYESATGLAEDIERYLADEPVLAHRPTKLYRLRKFYDRNRLALVAGGAVAAALVVAAITSTVMYLSERDARSRAVSAEEKARLETDKTQDVIRQLGENMWQLGDALAVSTRREDAEQIFTEALRTYDNAVRDFPESEYLRREQAFAEYKLADFLQASGRIEEAEPHLRTALRENTALKKEFPGDAWYEQSEAGTAVTIGDALLTVGRNIEAEESFKQAVDLLRPLAEKGDANAQDRMGGMYLAGKGVKKDVAEARRWLLMAAKQGNVISESSLGEIYDQGLGVTEDPHEAAKWYRLAADHDHTIAKIRLARLLSEGRGITKDDSEATKMFHEAAEKFKKINLGEGDLPAVNELAWQLVTSQNAAVCDSQTAVEMAQLALAKAPKDGGIWNTLGVAEYRAGNLAAAVKTLKQSIEFRNGGDAFDYFFLAMAQQKSGRPDDARKSFDKALKWMEMNAPRNRELIRFRAEAAETLGIPLPTESNSDHASAAAKTAADPAK